MTDEDIKCMSIHASESMADATDCRITYLRHTSHRTGGELVDEGEGLLRLLGHDGGGLCRGCQKRGEQCGVRRRFKAAQQETMVLKIARNTRRKTYLDSGEQKKRRRLFRLEREWGWPVSVRIGDRPSRASSALVSRGISPHVFPDPHTKGVST